MSINYRFAKIFYRKSLHILKLTIFLFFITSTVYAHDKHVLPWGYEGGTGPEHWGEIEHDHEKHIMCRNGVYQSPIDIRDVPGLKLAELGCNFSPTPMRIMNNGHTIQLTYNTGSFIDWGNERFELIQFHFHSPSEHLVNGKHYDMEVHLIHKTQDHQYVVVGIFMKKGKHNPYIQEIWDHIPSEIDKEIKYDNILVNAGNLLPKTKEYFHYTGSLTTPPCTESVSWFVLEEPIEISPKQVEFFKKHIHHNARPSQKLHHRIVVKIK